MESESEMLRCRWVEAGGAGEFSARAPKSRNEFGASSGKLGRDSVAALLDLLDPENPGSSRVSTVGAGMGVVSSSNR